MLELGVTSKDRLPGKEWVRPGTAQTDFKGGVQIPSGELDHGTLSELQGRN